ncbi:MAG: hypothetical protein IKP32_09060 [Clostridia bacterium]|nr:hypothetical protein [Clostridia bacterium]
MKKGSLILAVLLLMSLIGTSVGEETTMERLPDEVLMTYYNDTAFVGDSLIRMFRNYVKDRQKKEPNFFKGIKFYSSYSYQLRTAALEWVNPDKSNLVYKGSDEVLCKIMKDQKPARLFILAGLNDNFAREVNGVEGIDRGMRAVTKIMELMEKYSPTTQVYFFSMTPVTQKVENKRHIREKWDEYNAQLEKTCQELGAVYVDIATPLKDENGLLPKSISNDNEYHLNDKGNAIWAQALLDFAQAQYEAGQWTPAGYAQ